MHFSQSKHFVSNYLRYVPSAAKMSPSIQASTNLSAHARNYGTWCLKAFGPGVQATLEMVCIHGADERMDVYLVVYRSMFTPNRIASYRVEFRNSSNETIWEASGACDDSSVGFVLIPPSAEVIRDAREVTLTCQVTLNFVQWPFRDI
jgi:hypothetical protein